VDDEVGLAPLWTVHGHSEPPQARIELSDTRCARKTEDKICNLVVIRCRVRVDNWVIVR
jgi:hypothetical protein